MRQYIANALIRLANLLGRKSAPSALTGTQWSGTQSTDLYHRHRVPTANELLAELKNTAWTCASLNASVCAGYEPALYVITQHNQPVPKCQTKKLNRKQEEYLRDHPRWRMRTKDARLVEEVTAHPILELLGSPSAWLSSYDLWELTHLYQEVMGVAYWYLKPGPLGIPNEIWVLPAQNVTPVREANSLNIVDYYRYRVAGKEQRFTPDCIINFRYPDPRDPYNAGLSPLRAAFEQVAVNSHYLARKQAVFDNDAIPSALVTPEEVIGEEERDRLEVQWNQKLRKGGAGRIVVGESKMNVALLQHSLGDIALLADVKASKEDIANAFHVPIAFFTTQTNLANLQASQSQHSDQAITPRLTRRDEKLNASLVPRYDLSGRLFLASEDPTPVDMNLGLQQQESDLKYGVVTINDVRSERGLPPVEWGDVPWLPMQWAQTDYIGRVDPGVETEPNVGRNKPSKPASGA
jgi:HK97 family phage portal protein